MCLKKRPPFLVRYINQHQSWIWYGGRSSDGWILFANTQELILKFVVSKLYTLYQYPIKQVSNKRILETKYIALPTPAVLPIKLLLMMVTDITSSKYITENQICLTHVQWFVKIQCTTLSCSAISKVAITYYDLTTRSLVTAEIYWTTRKRIWSVK